MKKGTDVIKKLFKITETAINSPAAYCPFNSDGDTDCTICPFSIHIGGCGCGVEKIKEIMHNCQGSIPGFCDKEESKDVQC